MASSENYRMVEGVEPMPKSIAVADQMLGSMKENRAEIGDRLTLFVDQLRRQRDELCKERELLSQAVDELGEAIADINLFLNSAWVDKQQEPKESVR